MTAAPPASLRLFQRPYGLGFILALVFCRKLKAVRNWMQALFLVHMVVRVWALVYFAPAIADDHRIPEHAAPSPGIDPALGQ